MPTAERVGDRIYVQTIWSEKDQMSRLPGANWNNGERRWMMPLSWAACLQLRGTFGDRLNVDPALAEWSWTEYNDRIKPALEHRELLDFPEPLDFGLDPRLYPFQRAGVEWMTYSGSGLLGDDMGSGKTVQMLEFIRVMESLPALIIPPNGVVFNWARECRTWLPGATPYALTGSVNEKRKLLETARNDPTALVITNIESVRLLSRLAPYGSLRLARCRECDPCHGEETLTASRCEVHPKPLNSFPFVTVVVDEAHRIRHPNSKQTRAVWSVSRNEAVRYRWALTGTPIANHVGDLWSIMHFVAPHEYPVRGGFIDRYAQTSWNRFGGLDITGVNPLTKDEFFRIFDPRFRRMPKKLVLPQLPPRVLVTRYVQMSPKQRKAYRELESNLVTVMDDGQVLVAPNNLVGQTRLLQLAATYCDVEWVPDPKPDDPDNVKCVVTALREPSPKIDELLVVLEELGDRPVVVAAESRRLIELAAARLEKVGVPHELITGAQSQWERDRALDLFQRGETRVLLVTIGAGGEGLSMTAADTMIYLQRSFKMIGNAQMDARIDRPGAEKHMSLTYIDIVTEDTVEVTKLIPRLREKQHRLEEIVRDRDRLRRLGRSTDNLDAEELEIMGSNLGW